MKKILSLIVISSFLFIPFQSFARSIVADSDLASFTAQSGSITITFNDIYVASKALKTTSTDGLDFWNPRWDQANMVCGTYPCHADYYSQDHPDYENNWQGMGTTVWPNKGYIGYTDVYVTGGLVERSGYIRLEVVANSDPNVWSRCQLNVIEINQTIKSHLGIDATIKLGPTSDLAGNQVLGRTYTSGVGATTTGSLSVYAHNNSLWP
jgi:hypothetical protein